MNTKRVMTHGAYIITGPTSGLGKETAFAMKEYGTLILVGRNATKLISLKTELEKQGGKALTIVCDMSDLVSVKQAADAITQLNMPLLGLINNAGIQNPVQNKTKQGWDKTYVTNHLGPFLLTDALLPHFANYANVLFIGSATEDPERGPAKRAGFRGGRYINAQSSLYGNWAKGGSLKPGMDAYATSKQCNIASAMALSREYPHININAMEPGIMFNTGLHDNMSPLFIAAARYLVPLLAHVIKVLSTPRRAAKIITKIMTDQAFATGQYYDEGGHIMQGSVQVHDCQFQQRVVDETRALITQLTKGS